MNLKKWYVSVKKPIIKNKIIRTYKNGFIYIEIHATINGELYRSNAEIIYNNLQKGKFKENVFMFNYVTLCAFLKVKKLPINNFLFDNYRVSENDNTCSNCKHFKPQDFIIFGVYIFNDRCSAYNKLLPVVKTNNDIKDYVCNRFTNL